MKAPQIFKHVGNHIASGVLDTDISSSESWFMASSVALLMLGVASAVIAGCGLVDAAAVVASCKQKETRFELFCYYKDK